MSDNEASGSAGLSADEVMTKLQKQIDFYFSRENLASDKYLVSHMSSEMFVDVDIIAAFKKVKSLTTDRATLLQAMRASDAVVLSEDETKVKPVFELKRNTIIIRELPEDVTEAQVKAIFDDPAAGKVVSVQAEAQNHWYVKFADEDITFSTFMWLRSQKYDGKPIRCRIKTESLLQGASPGAAKPAGEAPAGAPFVAGAPPGGNPYAYMGYGGPQYVPVAGQGGVYGYPPPQGWEGAPPQGGFMPSQAMYMAGQQHYYANAAPYAHSGTDQTYAGRRGGGRGGSGGKGGKGGAVLKEYDGSGRDAGGKRGRRNGDDSRRSRGSGEGRGRGKGARGGRGGAKSASPSQRKAPDFELGLQSFPPLPNAKGAAPKPAGYSAEFVKYPRDDLVKVIRSFADVVVYQPTELADSDAPVVLSEPNTTLEVEKPVPEIKRRKKNRQRRRHDSSSGGSSRGMDRATAMGQRRNVGGAKEAAPAKVSAPKAAETSAPAAAPTSSAAAPSSPVKKESAPATASAPAADSSASASTEAPAPSAGGKPTYADLFKKS
ncbi:uncharacterized protein AMSG_02487 [Thecamonas trahens ATCC 50062]|uniref:HTH La-type RNA-binding domain-containing protein n=1 Tax=Thecamonas trahens ATCC 50062 TaxID=461836 RepID=A0A0L0D5H8_THETB|nr:hypothetical protein AMSG_02487 [Thecamonas trahens ATCC 50062]KNC47470.1 hypothetical protein AMSG_02487 [Thecamonas trahens ATCC 50062]|eukprot:XP_013759406.1 hypothetical protein AMSG_02487 [Thecamonas trahens ATCC 50062]